MECCENTYNLGCFDSCAVVTLPILFPSDGQYTLFFNGTNNIKYKVVGVSGEPFIVDATLLNSDSTYTFYVVNNSGVRVVFDIDGVDYDCFKIKIETYFNIDATDEITPSVPCTLMCQETYDPTGVGADAFNYNNLHTKAVSDGITITGDGTAGNPFVAVGGGGGGTWGSITGTLSNQTDLQNALNLKYDASNPAGYITSSALSGYTPTSRTITINGATQDLSSNRTWTISVPTKTSDLTNDSGFITSSALSGYLQNNVGIAGGTTLIGGTASGNNLTLVSTSNATKGKILFIEDVGEYIYNVDRMMVQLKRSGLLKNLSALIVGQFTDMKDTTRPFGKKVEEVILDAVKEYNYPVCFNFPVGHCKENVALKCGLPYTLVVGKHKASLKEI